MNFVEIANAAEISAGQMKEVTASGQKLLLANVDGQYYASAQKCPHMGADLCKGKLEGHSVVCPRHGATFDLRTGKPLRNAKILFLNMKVKDVPIFPVKVDGAKIMVGI